MFEPGWATYGGAAAFSPEPSEVSKCRDEADALERWHFRHPDVTGRAAVDYPPLPEARRAAWVAAVLAVPGLLAYAEQTPALCGAVIAKVPEAVQLVHKQTADMAYLAVSQNPFTIAYVEEQFEGICLLAVQQDGRALRYVQAAAKTVPVCMVAVQQNGEALQYVPEELRTKAVRLEAVKQVGVALQFIEDQTDAEVTAALWQTSWALQYVHKQTGEMCRAAVRRCASVLQHVKKQTPEICKIAVSSDASALRYVKKQTDRLRRLALRNDANTIQHVDKISIGLFDYWLRRCCPATGDIWHILSQADDAVVLHALRTDFGSPSDKRPLAGLAWEILYDREVAAAYLSEFVCGMHSPPEDRQHEQTVFVELDAARLQREAAVSQGVLARLAGSPRTRRVGLLPNVRR